MEDVWPRRRSLSSASGSAPRTWRPPDSVTTCNAAGRPDDLAPVVDRLGQTESVPLQGSEVDQLAVPPEKGPATVGCVYKPHYFASIVDSSRVTVCTTGDELLEDAAIPQHGMEVTVGFDRATHDLTKVVDPQSHAEFKIGPA